MKLKGGIRKHCIFKINTGILLLLLGDIISRKLKIANTEEMYYQRENCFNQHNYWTQSTYERKGILLTASEAQIANDTEQEQG